ncbi:MULTISPECIES: ChaB family protein [unclassified Actinopolyspora]|uniref:ChaB family protein n=1 Tax=unclassified Actinopolyspora TaxID=2639451 RepID=UPI0013F61FE6|nr:MULTISPECIES: ChaB family protein [unclassified Actinopolyspora]NHD16090.1 cation transport regulator ChaB [Actinopolyspora sp. BKK2]NHE74696.1 cation transport regulator ChaB [Actinopolyspora sp. BKK1]
MPAREELPSTLRRSPKEAQETWLKTHDSAVREYGQGQRANRTAYAALKHSFEKVGDHWEPKPERGPSDEQARRGAGKRAKSTSGGVDARASKQHLYERARELDVPGRSAMNKEQLVEALQQESGRQTRRTSQR